jgi:hypothetical protein
MLFASAYLAMITWLKLEEVRVQVTLTWVLTVVVAVTELQWKLITLISSHVICIYLEILRDSLWSSPCKVTGNSRKYSCFTHLCCSLHSGNILIKVRAWILFWFRDTLLQIRQHNTPFVSVWSVGQNSISREIPWHPEKLSWCRHILIYPLYTECQDIYRQHNREIRHDRFNPPKTKTTFN